MTDSASGSTSRWRLAPGVELILASGSPRRRELLERQGLPFTVENSGVVEPEPVGFASAEAYVAHLAWLKGAAVAHRCRERERSNAWVLAADTAGVLDEHILNKPTDRRDAERILRLLQGTRHFVLTGVCLVLVREDLFLQTVATTSVSMRSLSDQQLKDYLDTGRWEGKAGAYGIQDHDDPFVEGVEGSFTNVVGLPMERLADLLAAAHAITERSPLRD